MTARKAAAAEPVLGPDIQCEIIIKHGKGTMTKGQLKKISAWLKQKALDVLSEGADYDRRFSARTAFDPE